MSPLLTVDLRLTQQYLTMTITLSPLRAARIWLHSSFQTFGNRPALSLNFSRLLPLLCAPLHTAQAVHEVAVEEYELGTYTPADWVNLLETRFSVGVEHLRQRFSQGTGSLLLLLSRVPSGVLEAWPCVLPVTLSETAHSLWSSRQVASDALLGSSRVWCGSASSCQGLAECKASLARSASLDACPLALPAPFVSGLFSGRGKLGASFWPSFSHLSLNLSTDLFFRLSKQKSYCGSKQNVFSTSSLYTAHISASSVSCCRRK